MRTTESNMNLTLDIGNSSTKATLFNQNNLVERYRYDNLSPDAVETLFDRHPIHAAIVCRTGAGSPEAESLVADRVKRFMQLDCHTPLPIRNLYASPESLGADRLAAAVGAYALMPERNLLVIDMGTAITIDVITASGDYLGGNISLGAASRFKALNMLTAKLPEEHLAECRSMIGATTSEALLNGVVNGIIFEIEGYIETFRAQMENLQPILTGGEANFFAKKIKFPIFVACDIIPVGLNTILEHNAE